MRAEFVKGVLFMAAAAAAKPWWRETFETVLWALVIALILRTFVVQAFWIPSRSMVPTLQVNDRVLVAKFWYHIQPPKRGQIFVFKYPVDPKRDFVKRIIGLPGETIAIREGIVYINNEPVPEEYVKFHDSYSMDPLKIPEDSYFAMGDNRPNSADSRFWGFVPRKNIRGPVFFRYWPLNRLGMVD
jgi:signal peptidase I